MEDGIGQLDLLNWKSLGDAAEQLAGALRRPEEKKGARERVDPARPRPSARREDRAGSTTPGRGTGPAKGRPVFRRRRD